MDCDNHHISGFILVNPTRDNLMMVGNKSRALKEMREMPIKDMMERTTKYEHDPSYIYPLFSALRNGNTNSFISQYDKYQIKYINYRSDIAAHLANYAAFFGREKEMLYAIRNIKDMTESRVKFLFDMMKRSAASEGHTKILRKLTTLSPYSDDNYVKEIAKKYKQDGVLSSL